jgi:tetratricopeptide (TPR) repeat protein
MKKHEHWSDDRAKKPASRKKENSPISYGRGPTSGPPSVVLICIIILFFGTVSVFIFGENQRNEKIKSDLVAADKAFAAADYKNAEADYLVVLKNYPLTNTADKKTSKKHNTFQDENHAYAVEKLALCQIAQQKYDEAQKNLDSALDLHLQFVDNSPRQRRRRRDDESHSTRRVSRPDQEAIHILRILNNKSQLLYLENKKEEVPKLLDRNWSIVFAKEPIQKIQDRVCSRVLQAQLSSLGKRQLNAQEETLRKQIDEVNQGSAAEKASKTIAILKAQLPPDNAQLANCDFGVFSLQ